jgi:hypothetical protein
LAKPALQHACFFTNPAIDSRSIKYNSLAGAQGAGTKYPCRFNYQGAIFSVAPGFSRGIIMIINELMDFSPIF